MPLGVGSYTSINPAPGRVESLSLLFTWAIPVWRVHVAGVGILHSSRPECVDGEVQQGPSPAGYNAEPLPRVTGEDLNGGEERRQQLSVRSNQRMRRATGA